jgi:hypothetical protein
MAGDPGLLMNQPSSRENSEVWNPANMETFRGRWIGVGIHLDDHCLSRHVSCRLRHLRRRRAAWPTPRGPEIDQNWNPSRSNDLVETRSVYLKGFVQWRKRSFAGAAAARISQMFRRYAIPARTLFACSNHWHISPP